MSEDGFVLPLLVHLRLQTAMSLAGEAAFVWCEDVQIVCLRHPKTRKKTVCGTFAVDVPFCWVEVAVLVWSVNLSPGSCCEQLEFPAALFFPQTSVSFPLMSSPPRVGSSAAAALMVVANSVAASTVVPGAAAGAIVTDEEGVRRKRAKAPKIDIDALIAQQVLNMKNAKKLECQARRLMRNEKRKKQRLVKKASSLTPDDLERIAVLKRCGLWDPATGVRIMSASEREAANRAVEVAAEVAVAPSVPTPEAVPCDSPRDNDSE